MATHEHTINVALAEVLKQTRRCWKAPGVVTSESTGKIRGSSKRPDILVVESYVSPVVIETEVMPATSVEDEARFRLGEVVEATGRTILSSIAVRLPKSLRKLDGQALHEAIRRTHQIEMALFTGEHPSESLRLPRSGWLSGSADDLSILAQHASVPPGVIDRAANVLVSGINDAAGLLGEVAGSNPGITHLIGEELRQEDCEQTRRMAAAILANAFVFHHALVGGPGGLASVKSVAALRDGPGLNQQTVLSEWNKILKVNYWPIFDIARRILAILTPAPARDVIRVLSNTADQLVENRLMRSHDLTGAVFQKLIADRKFLAAYYTTPAASALLSGLAITPNLLPPPLSWMNGTDMTALRIGDLACGTGTLLSTAYQHLGQLHELRGGDAESLHPQMMDSGLIGCDILPAATHLTASMLAGAHPTTTYQHSSIYTVAYGKQVDSGRIALGSIDLLDEQSDLECFNITSRSADPTGATDVNARVRIPHGSFHLVIMNPPFTRPTGHDGVLSGVPNAMFAGLGSSHAEQRLMGQQMKGRARGCCYHGNAGEASAFLALGHRKVRPGGVLALVMPLGLLAGESWEESRALLAKDYSDLVVTSIAGPKDFDVSFSADTGMGECLVVGRRLEKRRASRGGRRATFVILHERPAYPLIGAQIARQIRALVDAGELNRLEDGPVGGTPIKFGDEVVGQALESELPGSGPWPISRMRDLSLAQTAFQIASRGCLWLPGLSRSSAPAVPMSTVRGVGGIVGPHHRDIIAHPGKSIRGPFQIQSVTSGMAPTYPVLWGHDAPRERSIAFDADCEGLPIKGKTPANAAIIEMKVADIWATASHCHLNCDFRFNSQSTATQFTDRPTIGGRAWHSIRLATTEQEKLLALWGNTTFGLLMYWWHSSKQQTGRGSIHKTATESLPILDVARLSTSAIANAVSLFNVVRDSALLPMNEIDDDPVRHALDEAFGRRVLGLDAAIFKRNGPLALLRQKLASEPSIHRGKKSRVGETRS